MWSIANILAIQLWRFTGTFKTWELKLTHTLMKEGKISNSCKWGSTSINVVWGGYRGSYTRQSFFFKAKGRRGESMVKQANNEVCAMSDVMNEYSRSFTNAYNFLSNAYNDLMQDAPPAVWMIMRVWEFQYCLYVAIKLAWRRVVKTFWNLFLCVLRANIWMSVWLSMEFVVATKSILRC